MKLQYLDKSYLIFIDTLVIANDEEFNKIRNKYNI